jgi:two-component system response regulator HydG
MQTQEHEAMALSSAAARLMPSKNLSASERTASIGLLVIDDEKLIRDVCRHTALGLGYRVLVAENAGNAYKALESQNMDIVLLDMKLPGSNSGLEMLKDIRSRYPSAVVIVITGNAKVPDAVEAIKSGAYDYLPKPFNHDELRLILKRAEAHFNLSSENRVLRAKLRSKEGFGGMIGRAPEMEKLYRFISKAANSHHPVLIQGESGTGKELVARSIHFSGRYKDKKFIPVDCGAITPTLIESELFGHVKGAFTGAAQAKDGLLAIADGGTVFLDEIGELPTDLQAKLLRAIQEKEIRPVGSTRSIPIDARILAATNRDLDAAVQNGAFRRDLFFRLNVLALHVPALRERKQDIPALVGYFIDRANQRNGMQHTISDEALRRLLEYEWPGNVRELENCIERACAMNTENEIRPEHLPSPLLVQPSAASHPTRNGFVPLVDLEKDAILAAVRHTHGDRLQAAKLLGIGKTTLYRKLKEYGPQI